MRRLRRKAAPRRPANGDDRRQHGFLHYAQIPQVPFRRRMFPQKYDFQRLLIQIFFSLFGPFFAAEPLFGLIWFRNKVRVIECWTTQLTLILSREPKKLIGHSVANNPKFDSNKSNNNCEKTSEFKSTGILWVIVEIFLARAGTSWYLSGLWAR